MRFAVVEAGVELGVRKANEDQRKWIEFVPHRAVGGLTNAAGYATSEGVGIPVAVEAFELSE
jgi:hypothetical protein